MGSSELQTTDWISFGSLICWALKTKFPCKAHGFYLGARRVKNAGEQKEMDLFSLYGSGQPELRLDKKNPNDIFRGAESYILFSTTTI